MELGSPWYLSNSQFSAGALSYRIARPGALIYAPDICAAFTTSALAITAGSSFSYKARFNLEQNWDGVVVEISTDNGATWANLPPAAGYPGTLSATQGNACNYPATQDVFTGSTANAFVSASASVAAFAGHGGSHLICTHGKNLRASGTTCRLTTAAIAASQLANIWR